MLFYSHLCTFNPKNLFFIGPNCYCQKQSTGRLPIKKSVTKDLKKYHLNTTLPSKVETALTEDDENTQSDSYLDDISDNEAYSETDTSTMLNSSFIEEEAILATDCPANLQSIEKVQ